MLGIIKRKDSTNLWLIYYIFLGIIQAMWTNLTTFPPLPLRLFMTVAVFFPLFLRYDLILFVFPFFITLRGNLSTAYQYLPDVYTYSFYFIVVLILMVYHHKSIKFSNLKYIIPVIVLILLWGIVDLLNIYTLGKYVIHAFYIILLIPFVRTDKDLHLLSAAIIAVSAILALYYIIMYDAFLETWNADEGLERSGWSDPNYYATLIDSGFLVLLMYLPLRKKPNLFIFNTTFTLIASVAIFIAVTMLASRAGFICFCLILLFFALANKVKFKWYLLGILAIIFIVAFMYKLGVFDVIIYRMFEQGNLDTGGDRTTIWQLAIENFSNQSVLLQLFGGGYWHRASLANGADMHNEIVAILMDYGFLGLMPYIFLIFNMANLKTIKGVLFKNIPVIFFLMNIISLSPFQYMYISFIILWVILYKRFSDNVFKV